MILNVCLKLFDCFPDSFINHNGEFIAHRKANIYFKLESCKDELEVKCKVLEWFSRAAYKTEPFGSKKKNDEFHTFMLDGINDFLGTTFNTEDIEIIYSRLGNQVKRKLSIEFIESNYNLELLK